MSNKEKCGIISIIGRTNVGKSTLFNKIIKKKISIVSKKNRTTKLDIVGIRNIYKNHNKFQIIYTDTPGIYKKSGKLKKIFFQSDIILFLIESTKWKNEDKLILNHIIKNKFKTILLINKIDKIREKYKLLKIIKKFSKKFNFISIIPISAKKGTQVEKIEDNLLKYIPKRNFIYSSNINFLKKKKFFLSEFIREKILLFCDKEIPHKLNILIKLIRKKNDLFYIYACIETNKLGHKKILVGKKGVKIKKISTQSRLSIEKFLKNKVYLKLWVKLKTKKK